jgi:hypothetical protein
VGWACCSDRTCARGGYAAGRPHLGKTQNHDDGFSALIVLVLSLSWLLIGFLCGRIMAQSREFFLFFFRTSLHLKIYRMYIPAGTHAGRQAGRQADQQTGTTQPDLRCSLKHECETSSLACSLACLLACWLVCPYGIHSIGTGMLCAMVFFDKTGLFWSFPYVCPEPVLVKDDFYT